MIERKASGQRRLGAISYATASTVAIAMATLNGCNGCNGPSRHVADTGAQASSLQTVAADASTAETSTQPAGFVVDEELSAIEAMIERGEHGAARTAASAILARPSSAYASPKEELLRQGRAYFARARAGTSESEAIADLERAVALGEPEAPYHLGSRLLIAGRFAQPARKAKLLSQANQAFRIGAQLGETRCQDLLETQLKLLGRKEEEAYWAFLRRMTEGSEAQRASMFRLFHDVFTPADRSLLERAMADFSVSGGKVPRSASGVPGRSVATSLLVEMFMRKQLAFVWQAFFLPTAPSRTLAAAFEEHKELVKGAPFARTLLLTRSETTNASDKIALTREQLGAAILPGDTIVTLAGGRSHYVTVWSLDRNKDDVRVLDPFPEFWQPSHNAQITRMEQEDFLPGRQLIRLAWSEVLALLEAAIAVRDAPLGG